MSFSAALEALGEGEVVGMPTDTVYGLAIDPFNDVAVERLFELKGRPAGKPIGLLAASLEQATAVADLDGAAGELARRFWPGALTLVVRPKVILSDWVGDTQRRTLGVRVPDHETALAFLAEAGPLAVTSANESDGPETRDDAGARDLFGERVAVYLEGVSPGGVASTVVDVTGPEMVVLRRGEVDPTA